MSVGSDETFTYINDFYLNQLLGYQDMNELKRSVNRIEAALADQHAWDRDSNDASWAGSHADPAAGPEWDLGSHAGNVGIDTGDGQTTYWGDGQNVRNVARISVGTWTGNGLGPASTQTFTPSNLGNASAIRLLLIYRPTISPTYTATWSLLHHIPGVGTTGYIVVMDSGGGMTVDSNLSGLSISNQAITLSGYGDTTWNNNTTVHYYVAIAV